MAIARAQLVDLSLTRWYHCMTRCVRRAFLLGEAGHNRKEWLEDRLEELAGIFAVTVELEVASDCSTGGSRVTAGLEESLWLCPIEDRHELGSPREGMIPGFSLGSYITLVDYTGRLFREGKTSISAELAGIFERLGCSAQSWQIQIEKLRGDRLLGRFFATSRAKLREIAERLGVRRVINLRVCPIR
jgi:hypothetical protein